MRALPVILAVFTVALIAAPALAADLVYPVNKDLMSGNLTVHVLKVTITDKYEGNTYSADPENTIWPKVWFTYENKGTVPVNGNLYVTFVDDKGNKYWNPNSNSPIADITMDPVQPGSTSGLRLVEAAAPRGTNIAKVILYNSIQKEALVIDLTSISPGATVTSQPVGIPSPFPSALTLLIILVVAAALKLKR